MEAVPRNLHESPTGRTALPRPTTVTDGRPTGTATMTSWSSVLENPKLVIVPSEPSSHEAPG